MRGRYVVILIALSICVGLTGCDNGGDDLVVMKGDERLEPASGGVKAPRADDFTGDKAITVGERVGDVLDPAVEGVYEVLAEATEAAVTPGHFNQLIDHFTAADRRRFAGAVDDTAIVDDAARPFVAQWETTFDRPFDITQPREVFAPMTNIEPHGKVGATVGVRVNFLASARGGSFSLDLTKEHGQWRIDIADGYQRVALRASLVGRLMTLGEAQADWPDEPVQMTQTVAREVLSAIAESPTSTELRPTRLADR